MSTSRPPLLRIADADPAVQPLAARSDDDLMLLARAGRDEAFDTLMRRHQRRALTVATRYLGHRALAQDVAQSAFIELFRALPHFRAQGRFSAFWHRLLLNQCRMAARTRGGQRAAVDSWAQQPPDHAAPTDEVLIALEQRRDVQQALAQVREKLRVVLVLRFAGGLPLQDIADTLELPVGTVKSRLFAGLAALRELLKGDSV